ncbi:MAG: caspase family protein [Calothrix sp. MO_192.B10]|nr:caspase family protein [Calothrix sp. MO_192.B10]
MAGIPPKLLNRLRDVLLECEQFASDDTLKAVVFPHTPLKPWRFSFPQANSIPSRVDAVIGYLVDKRRSDTKENALVLLVHLLGERIPEGDERHQQLVDLALELEDVLGNNSTTNQAINIRGNTSQTNNQVPELRPIKNRWAFLVGVNSYNDPNFSRLNFCVDDVLALEERLKALNYRVVCLHDTLRYGHNRFPTRDNVEAELIQLCQMVEPDDLLLVHFACHGNIFNGTPVLILNNTRLPTWEKTGLTLEQVKGHMRSSKARRLVLTLDACHMGVETGRGIDDPQFIHNAYELAEGFALIAASTAQQKARESQDKKFGVFTYYLLEALNGKADRGSKGFVTVDDIKTYVLDSLKGWSVENGGIIQEPTAYTEGLGDIILADYRNHPG